MGDTSGTIEKVTRKEIAMELFRRSWVLKTYVSQLEADNAKLQAENAKLLWELRSHRDANILLELQAYRDIRAKSYGAALHECPLGKYPRWEDLDIPGG